MEDIKKLSPESILNILKTDIELMKASRRVPAKALGSIRVTEPREFISSRIAGDGEPYASRISYAQLLSSLL